jgi:hypothetical protein
MSLVDDDASSIIQRSKINCSLPAAAFVDIQEGNPVCSRIHIVGERAMNQIDRNISYSGDVTTHSDGQARLYISQAEDSHKYFCSATATSRSTRHLTYSTAASLQNGGKVNDPWLPVVLNKKKRVVF